jgi:hypothetical protein
MARMRILGPTLVLLTGLAGCNDEIPTSVGAGIVDPGFRTYEVVLDADAFLQADTTYDRIGSIHEAPFVLVARAFETELDAHTLFRVRIPEQVTWQDTAGTTMTDSVFDVVGGALTLVLDSLSDPTGPVDLELMELTESWDPGSVSWELRSDTAGAVPWTEDGGTTGGRLATVRWVDGDTIVIPLDSAAAAVWTDSAAAFHGGLVRTGTPGSRLRIEAVDFSFDVRPESQDTVVEAGSAAAASFIVTPEPDDAATGELRVGGVPTWRSAVRFRPLDDLEIPCAEGETCPTGTRPLSETTVNLASLVLAPLRVGSRRIERPFRVEARAILRAPGVPINRSALASSFGTMEEAIEPGAFREPGTGVTAEIPLTSYVTRSIEPVEEEEDRVLWIALLAQQERAAPVFGYGAFGGLQSDMPPQLRLVVTARIESAQSQETQP